MKLNVHRLRSDASKCRDLASTAITVDARQILAGMAAEYDEAASALERAQPRTTRPAFHWPQLY